MRIELFLIPGPVDQERLSDKTLVLIDVLRASTTICQSLKAGAKAVIPVERPGEAAEMRTKIGVEDTVLCGERGGIKIDSFDLGNSPAEYTSEIIGGKTVILTTSNGTRLYSRASKSNLVITAGIVNISKVFDRVIKENKDLTILCAGNDGDFSIEDTLCGGMLINRIVSDGKISTELNDAASLALLLYNSNRDSLADAIAKGKHGRHLNSLGFANDVKMASEPDIIPVLPVYTDNRIMLEQNSVNQNMVSDV